MHDGEFIPRLAAKTWRGSAVTVAVPFPMYPDDWNGRLVEVDGSHYWCRGASAAKNFVPSGGLVMVDLDVSPVQPAAEA